MSKVHRKYNFIEVQWKLLWVHQKILVNEAFRNGNRCLEMVSGETITYFGPKRI